MVTTKLKTMFAPEKRLENGTSEFHPRVFHVYHSFYIKKFVFIFILSSYFTLNIFVLLKQLRINLKFWEASEGTQPGRAAWKSQIRISERERKTRETKGGRAPILRYHDAGIASQWGSADGERGLAIRTPREQVVKECVARSLCFKSCVDSC